MTTPVFNPTPRDTFQQDNRRLKEHLELIARPQLTASIQTAILEYQRRLARTSDLNEAAGKHFKMVGVTEFLDIFWRLAEQTAPGKVKVEGQLMPTN